MSKLVNLDEQGILTFKSYFFVLIVFQLLNMLNRLNFLIFVLLGNTQFTEGACKYFLVLFAEAQDTYGNDL